MGRRRGLPTGPEPIVCGQPPPVIRHEIEMQHTFDVISVLMLVVFACFLIFGSFYQVFVVKFCKWEMFGTAFDPPIPATTRIRSFSA